MQATSRTPESRPTAGRARGFRLFGAALVALLLTACQADELGYGPKHLRSVSRETKVEMAKLQMSETAPVLMRIFKEENTFEVWKQDRTGRYQLLKTYEICKWSGEIGPKFKEGDRQAPEGYYTITPALMNPNSSYHLAFNTGYPNAYDRSHGRTGTHLMVHGACSSRGCYAMTDEQIQEIYALARDAFRGGQKAFQLQAYPFRMTPENMARHWNHQHMPFWKMLKEGYDHFELTRQEPKVDVCGRRYVFNVTPKGSISPVAACPELEQPEELRLAVARKAEADEAKAIEIAARLEEDRKVAEEREILVAARAEEEKRRAEEGRIAAANRSQAIASLFGLGSSGADEAETGAYVPAGGEPVAAAAPTLGPDGRPLPRPIPRDDTALALAPEKAPQSGSMFSRLFSFGDEEDVPPPATATATAAPTAGSETPTAAVAATVTPGIVTPGIVTPGIVTPGIGTAGPAIRSCDATAAAANGGACPPAGVATVVDGPVAVADSEDGRATGLFDRIGSWF